MSMLSSPELSSAPALDPNAMLKLAAWFP